MLNKLLILILKHKIQKLVYKQCGDCADIEPNGCDYCDIYLMQKDIKDVIYHLKEKRI